MMRIFALDSKGDVNLTLFMKTLDKLISYLHSLGNREPDNLSVLFVFPIFKSAFMGGMNCHLKVIVSAYQLLRKPR